jgi:hypothetical protein
MIENKKTVITTIIMDRMISNWNGISVKIYKNGKVDNIVQK